LRRIGKGRGGPKDKPLKVMAFDEARFGLINWHRRRYCTRGFRPPWIVRRRHEWSWLYAAVDPRTGESFCSYMPRVDGGCLEAFLGELGKAYLDNHLVLVMDNAPPTAPGGTLPENMTLLKLPRCSPELNPAERWFQVVQTITLQQDVRQRRGSPASPRASARRTLLGRTRALEEAHGILMVGRDR
jgi:hypothetical protein